MTEGSPGNTTDPSPSGNITEPTSDGGINTTDPEPTSDGGTNTTDSSPNVNITEPTSGNGTRSPPMSERSLGWVAVPVLLVVLVVVLVLCGLWCRWLYQAGERRYWRRVHNEHLRAAGAGTSADTSADTSGRQERDSSEETEGSVESDRRGLFSWKT